MKRRECFSEFEGAKRVRSRRELYDHRLNSDHDRSISDDDRWNSDDRRNSDNLRSPNHSYDGFIWNEGDAHRVRSPSRSKESIYSHRIRSPSRSKESIYSHRLRSPSRSKESIYSHRLRSPSRSKESIYSHKSDDGRKEKCLMLTGEERVDTNSFYKDLCISYIPSRISNSDLEDGLLMEFEKYGRVSVKIINKGVERLAYVRFAQQDDAKKAFSSIENNPLLLDSRTVEVRPCYKKLLNSDRPIISNRRSTSDTNTFRKSRDLRSTGGNDKRSFSPKPEYDAAMYSNEHYNGEKHQAKNTDFPGPTRVLFVGNLERGIERSLLQDLFGSYGKIEDVDIKNSTNKGGYRKTYAFIKFFDIHSALEAKKKLNHSNIGGKKCNIGFGWMDADVLRENVLLEESKFQSTEQERSILVRKIAPRLNLSHGGERVKLALVSKSDVGQREKVTEIDHKSVNRVKVHRSNDEKKQDVLGEKYHSSNTPTKVLFVGHLDLSIEKFDLKQIFQKFGNVVDIEIKETSFGMKFAFVKFLHIHSSKKAYSEMLGNKIGKHICKLGYSEVLEKTIDTVKNRPRKETFKVEKKPEHNKDPITALRISQIPPRVSYSHLRSILEKTYIRFTKLKHLSIEIKNAGKDRIAYVKFKNPDIAQKAMNAKILVTVMNKPVKVTGVSSMKRTFSKLSTSHRINDDIAVSDDDILEPELDEKATRTLFIGNLPSRTSEKELHKLFEKYGQIEFVTIKKQKGGKLYGFVNYINMDCAYKAKVEMNGRMFRDCNLKIGYGKLSVTSCLWVGGLGVWVDGESLRKEFNRFGKIRRIVWPKGSDFAYVQFEDNAAAEAACHKLHGWPMGGLDKRLRVDFVNVNQILTALEKIEKTDDKNAPAEDDKDDIEPDDDENQSDPESEVSLESDIAKSFISDKSLESENALSISDISENSLAKSYAGSTSRSTSEKSCTSSIHSDISNQMAVVDEGSGIWAQPSEDSLIIKTPFSPLEQLSHRQIERAVFVHSKEKIKDDYNRHHESHRREPDMRYSHQSPRRVGESLQQEIKHYRRESGLLNTLSDSYKTVYDRPRGDDVYEGTPAFSRDQYLHTTVLNKYVDKNYERKYQQEHQDSDFNRMDFLEQNRASHSKKEMSNDLRKSSLFERQYQEIYGNLSQQTYSGLSEKSTRNKSTEDRHSVSNNSHESVSRNKDTEHRHGVKRHSHELSPGYSDKSTRYTDADLMHGVRNSYSREHSQSYPFDANFTVTQRPEQQWITPYNTTVSGRSSYELPKALSNSGGVLSDFVSNLINFGVQQPTLPEQVHQKRPISYGDTIPGMIHTSGITIQQPFQHAIPDQSVPSHGITVQQPFQHAMRDCSLPSHGNLVSGISNPGDTMNVPGSSNTVQASRGQRFSQRFAQSNPAHLVTQRMIPISNTLLPDSGQHTSGSPAERHYPLMNRPESTAIDPKAPHTFPWHIRQ